MINGSSELKYEYEKALSILEQRGYKEKTLIQNYRYGTMEYDLAIIPQNIKTPIAIFEFRKNNYIRIEFAKKIYLSAKKDFGCVPCFVISDLESSDGKIYKIVTDESNNGEIILKEIEEVPRYSELLKAFETSYSIKQGKEISTKKSALKIICWCIVPTIGTLLLLLNYFGKYEFNTQRLIVLGFCMIALIFPCVEKIGVSDFDISFKDEEAKK